MTINLTALVRAHRVTLRVRWPHTIHVDVLAISPDCAYARRRP